jgi:hypothetical protein
MTYDGAIGAQSRTFGGLAQSSSTQQPLFAPRARVSVRMREALTCLEGNGGVGEAVCDTGFQS